MKTGVRQHLLTQVFVGAPSFARPVAHSDSRPYWAVITPSAMVSYFMMPPEDVDRMPLTLGLFEHDLESFGDLTRAVPPPTSGSWQARHQTTDGVHGSMVGATGRCCRQAGYRPDRISRLRFRQGLRPDHAERRFQDDGTARLLSKLNLASRRDQVVLGVVVERVDFNQARIGFHVALVQLRRGRWPARWSRLASQCRRPVPWLMRVGQTGQRIHQRSFDLVRRAVSDLFDVHAASLEVMNATFWCRGRSRPRRRGLLNVRTIFDVQTTGTF